MQGGEFLAENEGALRKVFPESTVERAALEGVYVPGTLGPEQFTGMYTMKVLDELAGLPEDLALNLSESEDVRSALNRKIERDQGHPLTRKDLQETRNFFANKQWVDVVTLIRKGVKPGAALATLGFSASSLAGDDEE